MRTMVLAALLVFSAQLLVPAWLVVDFLIDQDRVARELCVQRMVPDDLRTCRGHCYLSERLKKVDDRARDLPGTLRALKMNDQVPPHGVNLTRSIDPIPTTGWVDLERAELAGHRMPVEPVPWG